MSRSIHWGVFVLGTGNHIAGWRWPGAFDSFEILPVVQAIATRAADGFNILPATFPKAFDAFVDEVVPILQRRNLFRRE